mgnify:FL=1
MSNTPDEDGEWEFSLDEVTEGGQVQPQPEPIEPGVPTAEGVFFVLLGIALTVFVLVGF